MKQYLGLVKSVLAYGIHYPDRTGTGAYGIFGYQMRFNLRDGFPLVTAKYTWFKGVFEELVWMMRGETNIKSLNDAGVHIWDAWADEKGELGPIYGAQWRRCLAPRENNDSESDQEWVVDTVDQLAGLIERLRMNPYSRRHIMSAWIPGQLPNEKYSAQDNVRDGLMALAPCHCLVQFHVTPPTRPHEKRPTLSCQLYQRSADVFLGLPFNIASYALLTHLLAHHLDYEVGEFIWTGGDCHLYANHLEQAKELVTRKPKELPRLQLLHHPEKPLWDLTFANVELVNYQYHPAMKGDVAV